MTFKSHWEKTHQQHHVSDATIAEMLLLAFPDQKIASFETISGGCANLNVKVLVVRKREPVILRIYLRDPDAAYREQKLGKLVKPAVPAPLIHFIGNHSGYRFAVLEYIPGITLRDLLLGKDSYDLGMLMREVGTHLARIHSFCFKSSGFFDSSLNTTGILAQADYLNHVQESLNNQMVLEILGESLVKRIERCLNKLCSFFPEDKESRLVHADFDPANILVDKLNGIWKITGILDWEFAYSGSILCDVANMLRYAHQMPLSFESSFLGGLKENGVELPSNWKISINILNILSLLDCLVRGDAKQRPNQCADILGLIHHFIQQCEEYSSLCQEP